MARMRYSRSFAISRAEITSSRVRKRIDKTLRTIEQMPGMGSSLVAASIQRRFGRQVLKALVSPYLIIYEYDRTSDTVCVYDLVSAWTVR